MWYCEIITQDTGMQSFQRQAPKQRDRHQSRETGAKAKGYAGEMRPVRITMYVERVGARVA